MSDISRTSVTSQVEFLEKIPCEKLKYRYNMKEPLKKTFEIQVILGYVFAISCKR